MRHPDAARLLGEKTRRDPATGCLVWCGALGKEGYGVIGRRENGRQVQYRAHREALQVKLGRDLPSDRYACHTCDNPACCEPSHLWEGSHAENMWDMQRKGRRAHGERSKLCLYSDAFVQRVRALFATGHITYAQLARAFQLPRSTTRLLCLNKSRKLKTLRSIK